MEHVQLDDGAQLMREGDNATHAYVLEDGALAVRERLTPHAARARGE